MNPTYMETAARNVEGFSGSGTPIPTQPLINSIDVD
jgi:hypothetical protein